MLIGLGFRYTTSILPAASTARVRQRQDPPIIFTCISARRRRRQARGYCPVEQHVVLLVRIHRQVVDRAAATEVLLRAQPGVLRRVEILPCDLQPGFLRIPANVGAHALEDLAVDIDPGIPRRMLGLGEGGVIKEDGG